MYQVFNQGVEMKKKMHLNDTQEVTCPMCHGTGVTRNPLLKNTIKCPKCNGTGRVTEKIIIRRTADCPEYCDNCSYQLICPNAKLEPTIILPAWNDMSEDAVGHFLLTASDNINMAIALVKAIEHPVNHIVIRNSGLYSKEDVLIKADPIDHGKYSAIRTKIMLFGCIGSLA